MFGIGEIKPYQPFCPVEPVRGPSNDGWKKLAIGVACCTVILPILYGLYQLGKWLLTSNPKSPTIDAVEQVSRARFEAATPKAKSVSKEVDLTQLNDNELAKRIMDTDVADRPEWSRCMSEQAARRAAKVAPSRAAEPTKQFAPVASESNSRSESPTLSTGSGSSGSKKVHGRMSPERLKELERANQRSGQSVDHVAIRREGKARKTAHLRGE